jgi:hypothetical protein
MDERTIVSSLLPNEVIEGLVEFDNASNAERELNLPDTLIDRMIRTGLLLPVGPGLLRRTEFGTWATLVVLGEPYVLPLSDGGEAVH